MSAFCVYNLACESMFMLQRRARGVQQRLRSPTMIKPVDPGKHMSPMEG
jgi:hypothetical protein